MGKVILTKYIFRLRAWRVLCSASARGQQASRLRPFPDCCQPPCRSPCKAATAHLQFTKADCRPDEKCPGSSLCWKYALWSPPKLMSSFLWEQLQDWSWMNLRVLLFWTYSSSYRACENPTLWSLMSASWLPLNLYFQGLVPLFTDLQTEDKCGFWLLQLTDAFVTDVDKQTWSSHLSFCKSVKHLPSWRSRRAFKGQL